MEDKLKGYKKMKWGTPDSCDFSAELIVLQDGCAFVEIFNKKDMFSEKYISLRFDDVKNISKALNDFLIEMEMIEKSKESRELTLIRQMMWSMMIHPDYVSGKNQEFIDYVKSAREILKPTDK